MTQHNVSSSNPALSWHAEVRRLLAKPFVARQGAYREGQRIGVQITPRPHRADTTVDLSVSIYPRLLPPPTATTLASDQAALTAFLEELRHADYHIRLAACEALGHLGRPEARAALQSATHDAHQAVRDAATWAITALDIPRVQAEDLEGLRLVLVQQGQRLVTPLALQVTNRRGQVRFRQVPAAAVCMLHLLRPQEIRYPPEAAARPALHLAAHELPAQESQGLAAQSAEQSSSLLPQTYEMTLEDGHLLCTLYRDERGQVALELRADAPQLQNGWVYVTAVSQHTQEETWRAFVALQPDRHGILTGTSVLSTRLDPEQGYTIHCEPIPLRIPGE
jgi:hypothetical protein